MDWGKQDRNNPAYHRRHKKKMEKHPKLTEDKADSVLFGVGWLSGVDADIAVD